jgi:hypothetical protein
MKQVLSLTIALAGLVCGVSAQDRTPLAPPSVGALSGQLAGLQWGARENPSLALSHDQAQKLLPLLKKWKDADLGLSAADAQRVWDQAEAVLTPEQKAYKFTRPPRQGGETGGGPGGSLSPHDRQLRVLERLIERLAGL